MKIYTKTGDSGETSLYGGKRIPKNHIRIKAYGAIDELNSLLGIVLSNLADKKICGYVNSMQEDLFMIGSSLAGSPIDIGGLGSRISYMEEEIDIINNDLPLLKNFILPQGCEKAAFLFYARAVARKVERKIVELKRSEKVDGKILVYFNRLSDFLFILARYMNFQSGWKETIWKG